MVGRAVADRAVVITDDYVNDDAFPHAPDPDRVVEDVGIRSMVVAPLVSGDQVFGALGTFSTRTERVQPRPDRACPLARRPRGRVDGQRPAHRRPRSVAPRALPARRDRAQPARDRGADQQCLRPRFGPPADRRRGEPADPRRRRDPRRPRHRGRRPALGLRLGPVAALLGRRARRPVDRARRRGDRSRAGREPGDRRGRRPRRGVSEVVTVRPLLRPDGVPFDDRGTDRRRRRPARRPRGVFAPSERLRRR